MEIAAKQKEEKSFENKKQGVYRYERHHAKFYRYLPLPDTADVEHGKAEYKNWVLELHFPKIPESHSAISLNR